MVEIQEQIERAIEHEEEVREHKGAKFRTGVAIYVGLIGLMLAVVHMAGAAASKHAMLSGLETSDTYAYYQAKVIRSSILDSAGVTINQIAAASSDPAVKAKVADQVKDWQADSAKAKDDPKGGHGMKQLLAAAEKTHEHQLRNMAQDENFDLAETLLQVAIVFASIAIVANLRILVAGSVIMALLGGLAGLNGWLLLVELL